MSLTKIARSGSVSQRYKSAEPYPVPKYHGSLTLILKLLFLLAGVEGAQGLGAGSLTSVAGTGAGEVLLPRKSWKQRCGTGTVTC
jgi:hypothetical protein